MSAADMFVGNGGALDGQGLNQSAAAQMTASVRDQLNANSAKERDELRANATSFPTSILDSLDGSVMEPLAEELVLVDLFENASQDLTHDIQWWETESSWQIRGRMSEAEHTTDLATRSEEGEIPIGPEGIAIPYTIKDYRIPEGQLEKARQTRMSLDTSYANGAGRRVGELLEDTVLWGSKVQMTTMDGYTLGCPGMLNVTGRYQQVGSGSWSDGQTAKADINEAIGRQKERKFAPGSTGYWLFIGTEQSNQFAEDYAPSVSVEKTTREKIEDITNIDRVVYVPRMPDGEALLLKPSPQVMDIARLPDGPLNLEWSTNADMLNQFKVYHLLAPRIKHNDDGNTGLVHIAGVS